MIDLKTLGNRYRRLSVCLLFGLSSFSCVHQKAVQKIQFHEIEIVGDLDLAKLNDEELFAQGTAFYAAEDYSQAVRYFSRVADHFPQSPHYRAAQYNAGLALEKLKDWDEAHRRFSELADPQKGEGDALDAAYRVAETLYHLERYEDAGKVLEILSTRKDLNLNKQVEARVQLGICQLESGKSDTAELTLRKVVQLYTDMPDKDLIDVYFPAQAQFFLGEVFRLHYEDVTLDPNKGADLLSKDLEFKSELLLSAQGNYLRAIRMGEGYWATAAGSQIGGLYENLYAHMVTAPVPPELNAEEGEVYRSELRKKIRVLLTKAITIYERTLETAERIGTRSPFVDQTKDRLKRMKDLLVSEAKKDEGDDAPVVTPPATSNQVPHSFRFALRHWGEPV